MKLAKLVPIFNQGYLFSYDNYQPISILYSICKVFETGIFNQLHWLILLMKTCFFFPSQYGFSPGYTTCDCSIDLIEQITASLDQRNYVVSLLFK